MNILLVEPDSVEAEIYATALTAAGHTVRHAISAQTAVQAADDQAPDLVILELQLPRHNGVEFLYEFRSYREWQQVPLLVYSYTPSSELARAVTLQRELGVMRVLYKPETSLAQLVAAVHAAAKDIAESR